VASEFRLCDLLPPDRWDSDLAKFYEVVDGHIVDNPPMAPIESIRASYLAVSMGLVAYPDGLGRAVIESLFPLDAARGHYRRPDLAFVSTRRWPLSRPVPPKEFWEVVPDLAVEFIRGASPAAAVDLKIDEYFRSGVAAVWVVYCEAHKVSVYDSPTQIRVLRIGDELDGGAVLPGFRIAVSELFDAGVNVAG
jgi:Uma2 family endonuclease